MESDMTQENAFPNPHRIDATGMTLRDYFAAKAMQTMLGWDNDHTNWDSYAEDAYMMADAMLKAREE
jgi:hypothetical protein